MNPACVELGENVATQKDNIMLGIRIAYISIGSERKSFI
jgi:hypothetical protein